MRPIVQPALHRYLGWRTGTALPTAGTRELAGSRRRPTATAFPDPAVIRWIPDTIAPKLV